MGKKCVACKFYKLEYSPILRSYIPSCIYEDDTFKCIYNSKNKKKVVDKKKVT